MSVSSTVPFAQAGSLTAEEVRVRCQLTTALQLELARKQLTAQRRLQWRISAFVSTLVAVACALMALPTVWMMSSAASKSLAIYDKPELRQMGHHRFTAPSRISFLSAQRNTPATQQCTLRDAPVALGAPAGHSTRLAVSIAEPLRMGGGVAADEGAEASGRGAPNSEPAAPLVPPMKVRSGTAQRPPASKRTKQEPVEAIAGKATGATCREPKRQAKGRTVDWAAALVVTVATLAALFSRSLARSQAPDEIGQVLQLREEVSRSQRELQARDQRIASTNATLDMLQKQMVLTDEQRAASAAENAELKAALSRHASVGVASAESPPLRMPACDLSRGCCTFGELLPTPRPFQPAPVAAEVLPTHGSQLVSLRGAIFDEAVHCADLRQSTRRRRADATLPQAAASAEQQSRKYACDFVARCSDQHDGVAKTPLRERSLNVVEACDTESPLHATSPSAAKLTAEAPQRCVGSPACGAGAPGKP